MFDDYTKAMNWLDEQEAKAKTNGDEDIAKLIAYISETVWKYEDLKC